METRCVVPQELSHESIHFVEKGMGWRLHLLEIWSVLQRKRLMVFLASCLLCQPPSRESAHRASSKCGWMLPSTPIFTPLITMYDFKMIVSVCSVAARSEEVLERKEGSGASVWVRGAGGGAWYTQ